MLYPAELRTLITIRSGRQDSNLRPPGPKPGAMTGLRYAPNLFYFCERERIRTFDRLLRRQMLYPAELRTLITIRSGRQDSNLRPPGPKPGAMTGLRYAPNFAESKGFEPLRPVKVDGLANRSVNHSGNSPTTTETTTLIPIAIAKIYIFLLICKNKMFFFLSLDKNLFNNDKNKTQLFNYHYIIFFNVFLFYTKKNYFST